MLSLPLIVHEDLSDRRDCSWCQSVEERPPAGERSISKWDDIRDGRKRLFKDPKVANGPLRSESLPRPPDLSRFESQLESVDTASVRSLSIAIRVIGNNIDDRLAVKSIESGNVGTSDWRRSESPFDSVCGRIEVLRPLVSGVEETPLPTSIANASNVTIFPTLWVGRVDEDAFKALGGEPGRGKELLIACCSESRSLCADRVAVLLVRCAEVGRGVAVAAGFGGRGGEERKWRSSCNDLKQESSACHCSAEHLK